MSRLYRDDAVVLRTYKLGEADRIVVLATRAHGKVRAVAKGVRKTTSKFGARLEPLSHVAVQLYPGRSLETITQAETIDGFRSLREDLDRYGRAVTVLEVMDQLTLEGESDPRRYQMLVGVLRTLAEHDNPLVVPAFLLKLLAHEGLGLEVEQCIECGSAGPLVAVDVGGGGARCASCRHGRAVSAEAVRVLQAVLGGRLATLLREAPSPATSEVAALATEAVEQLLERRLRTPGLLDRT